jgi:hypothetical protein
VVGSQIGNLTPNLSFGHNLCFKYPNGSCEPMKLLYENLGVHGKSNSQSGSSLGSVGVHSLTLSHTLGSMKCDSWASFLTRTFASPCLGREPKAKVVTSNEMTHWKHKGFNLVLIIQWQKRRKYKYNLWARKYKHDIQQMHVQFHISDNKKWKRDKRPSK